MILFTHLPLLLLQININVALLPLRQVLHVSPCLLQERTSQITLVFSIAAVFHHGNDERPERGLARVCLEIRDDVVGDVVVAVELGDEGVDDSVEEERGVDLEGEDDEVIEREARQGRVTRAGESALVEAGGERVEDGDGLDVYCDYRAHTGVIGLVESVVVSQCIRQQWVGRLLTSRESSMSEPAGG
jgi:hypothetical protein